MVVDDEFTVAAGCPCPCDPIQSLQVVRCSAWRSFRNLKKLKSCDNLHKSMLCGEWRLHGCLTWVGGSPVVPRLAGGGLLSRSSGWQSSEGSCGAPLRVGDLFLLPGLPCCCLDCDGLSPEHRAPVSRQCPCGALHWCRRQDMSAEHCSNRHHVPIQHPTCCSKSSNTSSSRTASITTCEAGAAQQGVPLLLREVRGQQGAVAIRGQVLLHQVHAMRQLAPRHLQGHLHATRCSAHSWAPYNTL
jgi:hypothetical protein